MPTPYFSPKPILVVYPETKGPREIVKICGKVISQVLKNYYRAPDHPMKLRIWGWVRRCWGYPRLTISYAQGGWITVDERDYLENQILLTGQYELEVWETLARFSVQNEIFWDVGGHIGSMAIRAGLDPRIQAVHIFEPDPIREEILVFNLSLNRGSYHTHLMTLGDREEKKILQHAVFPHTGGSTFKTLPDGGTYEGSFSVILRRADTLVFSEGLDAPTLMKMDVEGWEDHVFRGAERLLKEKPPKAIVFEANSDERGDIQNTHLVDFLNRNGYVISWIVRNDGMIYHRENYLAEYQGGKENS